MRKRKIRDFKISSKFDLVFHFCRFTEFLAEEAVHFEFLTFNVIHSAKINTKIA